jgi:tetratricopeptide (TPR) repeat protein
MAGNLKDAQGMIDAAAADLQGTTQALVSERARLLITRSNTLMQKHRFDEAMPDATAAVALLRPVGNADGQLSLALENVGNIELGRHALDIAEARYREALQLALQREGPDGLMVASLHINLGWVLAERSRYAEDLVETQQALDIESRVLGAEHPRTLIIQMQTGTILFHLGRYAQARELQERVLASQRRVLGADSPYVAGTLSQLGLTLTEQRDLDAAEHAFSEGMAISEKNFGPTWGDIDVARGYLGYVHLLQGKLALAEQELSATEAADHKREKRDSTSNCYRLGELARLRGDNAQARQWTERALKAALESRGENSEQAALAHHYLGLVLRDSGDAAAAEKQWRAALASYASYIPKAEHPLAATTRYELGLSLIERDDTRAEGLRLITEALDLREKFLGKDEPRTRQARDALAQATAKAR